MPRPRVYIETTIPSFYFDQRPEPSMVAKKLWTRTWWEAALKRYDIKTSLYTLRELERGPAHLSAERRSLLTDLPLLATTEAVINAAETYIRHRVMPAHGLDAFHLAIASVHECQFLATWDVQHLANAHKFDHIRTINRRLGLFVPVAATPLDLLGRVR